MTRLLLLALALAACAPPAELAAPDRPVAEGLIALDSAEGKQLLFESEANAAFLPLISHFVTQRSQTYCGVASISMVLNATETPAPSPRDYAPYRLFTQDNVLSERTDEIVNARAVARSGMSLSQVGRVLTAYDVDAEVHYASDHTLASFRDLAKRHLAADDHHVIVNYSRTVLDQEGAGHISPLGAYDAETDRFLILDVSRYKAPSVWVTAEELYAAMAEPVATGNRTRGFVLVRPQARTAGP